MEVLCVSMAMARVNSNIHLLIVGINSLLLCQLGQFVKRQIMSEN